MSPSQKKLDSNFAFLNENFPTKLDNFLTTKNLGKGQLPLPPPGHDVTDKHFSSKALKAN